ncbi:hypothetical protein BDA96_08G045500 [Sorghum bicolor]|uniref:Uncharacterized protein n=2 Tax=Sorghum bicolor TaxID=4558 RepID=A0A921QE48_SORBI|nr:uncharacterized protein LOC110429837 [Sorghum bicolor]KAG0520113.1 hypothetical protein BDA96_08G045500 [Sorghum bicolor]KXG22994.1 hypothetical protein SORBI_3008G041800 [Sorghum bicolor]|eukprot:XP_021302184.1 uncharacterized protein LOC110429837 [Sorghum bicolor]
MSALHRDLEGQQQTRRRRRCLTTALQDICPILGISDAWDRKRSPAAPGSPERSWPLRSHQSQDILAMGSNLLGSLCFMTLPCGYSYSSSHLAQAQLSVVHIYQKSKISQEIKCQNSLNVYYTVVVHILRGICSIMY